MKYSSRAIIGKYIICTSMILFSFIGMVLVAVITKLALILLSWFQNGAFIISWEDIIYAAKLGGAGGCILGFSWAILYLLKVKNFC